MAVSGPRGDVYTNRTRSRRRKEASNGLEAFSIVILEPDALLRGDG